ncbi:SLOG family protein [Streptomyces sp. NEAU-Y11]|uniref:SLOG family protein n=1 Tax=Streptomyces cucumeris TaxID=2962890 RepID=UPI0020C90558|nr:SLOG family protein [Streptomyces sp. NEAU-Y11]MCP9209675.1 DUF2493 domain-containing protein [Streptomyces sp. NEAU-Y11]
MKLSQGPIADRGAEELEALLASTFTLIVTGSRDWRDRRSIWMPLDKLLQGHGRIAVRNGKARKGLDRLVSEWAVARMHDGAIEIPHRADWDAHGWRAGFLRNGEMVDAGANSLLAWANPCRKEDRRWCPPGEHPSHGTADCARRARAAGIPVFSCPLGMQV